MSFNQGAIRLPPIFTGKWHKKRYTILRELGRGANGVVYLASSNGRKVAVKIGVHSFDILIEVNMLNKIKNTAETGWGRGGTICPALLDVDDVEIHGSTYSFYAMEYLQGERLDAYIQRAGPGWAIVFVIQLLARLEVIHRKGWIFGDIKPENIIVAAVDKQVRLIDFGGVSQIGNAVRQFTEDYDRASWQLGDRKAEVSYDLCSLAIMAVRLVTDKETWRRIRSGTPHVQVLCDIIRDSDELYPYRTVLVKAFHGKYSSAEAMRQELLLALREQQSGVAERPADDTVGKWVEGIFVASLLVLAGSLYYMWM